MTHAILSLQSTLVPALRADAGLTALIGASAVFDAPPADKHPPYVVIARHDVLQHDSDAAPGHEHRLLINVWAREPSRKAVLAIAERVATVALGAALDGPDLRVTHRQHERTDSAIDLDTGFARAAVTLRMFSEPA